jgi:DNA-3-methyladenine glycosylase I
MPVKDSEYKDIVKEIEATIINEGLKNIPLLNIQTNLNGYKNFGNKILSDSDYFKLFTNVIFYSGFKAAVVNKVLKLLHSYFPDYKTVANYKDDEVDKILKDPQTIKNRRKIEFCIANAKTFQSVVNTYGSFQSYIDLFSPSKCFENLMFFKAELDFKFRGLGDVTTFHFLTDIGMPVIKPDRVICRIFYRLGLIESEQESLKTVILGRKIAKKTKNPERYIDIVFVAFGQTEFPEFGLTKGICLSDVPPASWGASPFPTP